MIERLRGGENGWLRPLLELGWAVAPRVVRRAWATVVAILGWGLWPRWVAPISFILLLSLFFFKDAILFGQIYYERDTAVFYYPLASRLDEALGQGRLPLWTPYIFAGYPLFADAEAGMLYPLNLMFYYLFPVAQAFVWIRVVHFVLAGVFMFAYGRSMGMRSLGALVAALVFSFGGFLVAQLHHANVISSAIWLPLALLAVEMAFRGQGRRRYQWMVLGAFAVGFGSLGVHPQIVLMSLSTVLAYSLFRALFGPVASSEQTIFNRLMAGFLNGAAPFTWRLRKALLTLILWPVRRTFLLASLVFVVVLLGLGLAAPQLFPLYELSQYSLRSGGVGYQFATTYSLLPHNLVELILPYFFRSPEGYWWTLWAPWEHGVYIGIAPLILAGIGIIFVRNRYCLFFLILGAISLLAALGPSSPWDLYRYVWQLPFFSSMRAPGRFTYLFVLSGAVLAGWGAHWLSERLSGAKGSQPWPRGPLALYLALWSVVPVALVWAITFAQTWIQSNPEIVRKLIQDFYLTLPRGEGVSLDGVYNGLLASLSLANPRTALSILFLVGTFVLLFLWYGIGRPGLLWKGLLILLIAGDLLTFASSFHRKIPLEELSAPSEAAEYLTERTGLYRVFNKRTTPSMESNQLLPLRVAALGGYSSLQPQRHLEFLNLLRGGEDAFNDTLLDLSGVRYVVVRSKFTSFPSFGRTSFDPTAPLVSGVSTNPNASATFLVNPINASAVGVVATLKEGVDIPQGAAVAEITVVGEKGERQTIPLLAGVHLSEWAFDRDDVISQVRHKQAQKAFTMETIDPDGRRYKTHLYYAELPLSKPLMARKVEFRYTYPSGQIRLYGLSLMNKASGQVSQTRIKEKYAFVYQDREVAIYENTAPLPKAFVVPKAMMKKGKMGLLAEMAEGDFDPRKAVFLESVGSFSSPFGLSLAGEEDPLNPIETSAKGTFSEAKITLYSSVKVTLEAEAAGSSFLVLSDSYYPGWKAYVDGRPVKIYRANYLFRAISIPAGKHLVEFTFDPPLISLGWLVGLASLSFLVAVLGLLELFVLGRLAKGWVKSRSKVE